MYLFTRVSVMNYHKLDAKTTEISFSPSFGSQMSETKVSARLVLSRDSEKTVTCLSQLLVVAGNPWRSVACITPSSASVITWASSLVVFTWPLIRKDTTHWS